MNDCSLCAFDDGNPVTNDDVRQAYFHGFADGVRAILRDQTRDLCERHQAEREAVLREQGFGMRKLATSSRARH